MPIAPPPLSITERFARIIDAACKFVGAAQAPVFQVRGSPGPALPGPVALVIWQYLKWTARRFARLAEMARNGTLRPPRPRKPPAVCAERPKRPPRDKPLLRRSGFGWITRRVLGSSAFGGQLRALMETPEMVALIEMHPQFTTLLRPLLSALGTVPNPGQLPPPPVRAERKRREPKPPVPKPPRKVRAKKVRWWCAKPPRAGLIFSDESLN